MARLSSSLRPSMNHFARPYTRGRALQNLTHPPIPPILDPESKSVSRLGEKPETQTTAMQAPGGNSIAHPFCARNLTHRPLVDGLFIDSSPRLG